MEKKQYTILVVDDDPAMLEYACFALEHAGYKVVSASDGSVAFKLAKQYAIDALVTDIVMPEKEGIETIRDIKKLHPKCGIVAMSGAQNSDTYLSMAKILGANNVLIKPFTREQITEAVSSSIQDINRAGS